MANISLFIGSIAALPDSGRPTGIYKHPVEGPLNLGPEGFNGDQQADRRVHGGPEKAVHLYPAAHYAHLARQFPQAAAQLQPGSLGENISSPELDETLIRIGDIFRLGGARLQVCQPRSPCWKIDERFGVDGMAGYIAEHRLTGWYFRVLQPGSVTPNDPLEIDQIAENSPTLAAALALWQTHRPPLQALKALAATPGIASSWQSKINERAAWLERHGGQESTSPPAFHVKPEAR